MGMQFIAYACSAVHTHAVLCIRMRAGGCVPRFHVGILIWSWISQLRPCFRYVASCLPACLTRRTNELKQTIPQINTPTTHAQATFFLFDGNFANSTMIMNASAMGVTLLWAVLVILVRIHTDAYMRMHNYACVQDLFLLFRLRSRFLFPPPTLTIF